MGIVFHKLCYEVMDARTKRLRKQREEQKKRPLTSKLMAPLKAKREALLHGLVNEARVWMYAMSLKDEVVAGHDKVTEDNLTNTILDLQAAFLGYRIPAQRIRRVCGRIARNVLVPGVEDLDDDCDEYFPSPPGPKGRRSFLNDRYMKASTLMLIYKECAGFQQSHPHIRTWREIKAVAGPYRIKVEKGDGEEDEDGYKVKVEKPLGDVLQVWQLEQTKMYLGLPKMMEWSNRMKLRVDRQLRSKKVPDPITDCVTFKDSDMIVVVPVQKKSKRRAVASMTLPINVMKLYPRFYEDDHLSSLRNMHIRDGTDLIQDLKGCLVRFFLHEITHAKGVLETKDHTLQVNAGVLDIMPTLNMYPAELSSTPTPGGDGVYLAYGLESCLGLARRDILYNTNKAEDNADSWSFFFLLKMIVLVYPDLDITEAYETEDLFAPRNRHVRTRSHLLHHCTLFEPLRHERAGTIRDHPDYDASKDYCGAGSDNTRPTTIEDILQELKTLDYVYNS